MLKPNIRSLSISSQESYSAVMITDLVADVPVSPEIAQGSEKPVKEETNLGYDGHLDGESKSPAVDGVDTTSSHVANSGGITRGVILNLVQFGQPDLKSKSDEKTIQVPVPSPPEQISEPKGFKDMSFPRKVAFGFSFLPSVLFVLCFSIILPCNVTKPCIEEQWVKTFNNTEAISRLEIPQNVMFTAVKEDQNVLIELHKDSGLEQKTLNFDSKSFYLKCGNIDKGESKNCIIMDEEGKFYVFNATSSQLVWNPFSEEEQSSNSQPSNPILLPDCNGDETEEVAVAVPNGKIKIMYSITTTSTVIIPDCDSVPTKLMVWAVNGSSDLVFACKKGEEDKLVKVPEDMWCAYSKNPKTEALILHNGTLDSLNDAIILPVEDGLVLWSEDEISMIQPNGSLLWKVASTSHSEENRFLLYGNFKENKQVALLSSSISSEFKVTFLNPLNGNLERSLNFSDSEATDVAIVHGEKKDFIILLKKKVNKPRGIITTALTQINNFSTTLVNLISNEELLGATDQLTSQEVSFLDTEGKLITLKELKDLENAEYKTTMTAIYDEKNDVLNIYLLSTSEINATVKTTKVRNISIANWNQSKKSKCLGTVKN